MPLSFQKCLKTPNNITSYHLNSKGFPSMFTADLSGNSAFTISFFIKLVIVALFKTNIKLALASLKKVNKINSRC